MEQLIEAVQRGDLEAVKASKCDVNSVLLVNGKPLMNALMVAIIFEQWKVVDYLLPLTKLRTVFKQGDTALRLLAESKQWERVEQYMTADLLSQRGEDGRTVIDVMWDAPSSVIDKAIALGMKPDMSRALVKAAESGTEVEFVRALSMRPSQLNIGAISHAAERGKLSFVQMLFLAGATVNEITPEGTPVTRAYLKGHMDVVDYLLPKSDLSIYVNKKNIMVVMIQAGDWERVDRYISPEVMKMPELDLMNFLYIREGVPKELLEKVMKMDPYVDFPRLAQKVFLKSRFIEIAYASNTVKLVDLFMIFVKYQIPGLDIFLERYPFIYEHIPASWESLAIYTYPIGKFPSNKGSVEALVTAIQRGNRELVSVMLQNMDANSFWKGKSLLMYSLQYPTIFDLLLRRGADLTLYESLYTITHEMVQQKVWYDEIAMLGQWNKMFRGETPFLILCRQHWNESWISMAYANGADPNKCSPNETAGHVAIRNNNIGLLKWLLDKCDMNKRDKGGRTPLMLAASEHNYVAWMMLVKVSDLTMPHRGVYAIQLMKWNNAQLKYWYDNDGPSFIDLEKPITIVHRVHHLLCWRLLTGTD